MGFVLAVNPVALLAERVNTADIPVPSILVDDVDRQAVGEYDSIKYIAIYRPGHWLAEHMLVPVSVSYTHLTLPTILLV